MHVHVHVGVRARGAWCAAPVQMGEPASEADLNAPVPPEWKLSDTDEKVLYRADTRAPWVYAKVSAIAGVIIVLARVCGITAPVLRCSATL